MALNAGRLRNLMEMYAGEGGVNRSKIPVKLAREIMNLKLREFAQRSGVLSSKISRTSVASQQEYELGPDVIHITKVNYDGYVAHKIHFEDVDILQDDVS